MTCFTSCLCMTKEHGDGRLHGRGVLSPPDGLTSGVARRHGGTSAQRHGGTAARRHGGTAARRHGGTAARRHGGTAALCMLARATCATGAGALRRRGRCGCGSVRALRRGGIAAWWHGRAPRRCSDTAARGHSVLTGAVALRYGGLRHSGACHRRCCAAGAACVASRRRSGAAASWHGGPAAAALRALRAWRVRRRGTATLMGAAARLLGLTAVAVDASAVAAPIDCQEQHDGGDRNSAEPPTTDPEHG